MRHPPKPNIAGVARFLRKYRAGLMISAVTCVISVGLYFAIYLLPHPNAALRFIADIELRTLDTRFELRGPRPPGEKVVIVAIDQKSQDVLGRWPFPRSNFAEAVDVLREARARVIAFDANFPQPDQNSALQALRAVRTQYDKAGARHPGFDAKLRALEADADNDKKFAEALSRSDNVVLGYFFLPKGELNAQNQALVGEFMNYLSFQAYPQIINPQYARKFEGREYYGLSPDLPAFAMYAKDFGYYNVIPDADGVVRREPAIFKFQGSFYPSLDVAAILAYLDLPLEQVSVFFNPNGLERINIGSIVLPTDPEGFVQIDFYGPSGTFPTYSLSDVVQRKIPPEKFKDRLVLIGPTATGIADMAVTPFQTQAFPGVEVHANFLSNVLEHRFIQRGPRENLIDLGFIILFSLAAGFLLSVLKPVRATAVLLALLGVFLWLSYYLFATQRIWIAAFLPTATLTVNYAVIVSYRFFFEERERKRVHGAFAQYVAPSVIKQLLDRPELMRLGGEEKELTAMFSDIRNFTGISEGMTPAALVDHLNDFLSEMTEVIFYHWGTLDKYIGDSIMAFWGAPYPQIDHPERACRAGLEMLRALKKAQGRWQAEGKPNLNIGIGIHTGPMLVGNMGSKRRFNFTVMGDNVNLASRLEGLNKTFGSRLIVSETTYQTVQDKMLARELDWIRVKGKVRPVRIYELLDSEDGGKSLRDLVNRFHTALAAYRTGQWTEAIEMFGGILRDHPDDGPTRALLQRCLEYHQQPPEGVWDGVYVMMEK